MQTTGPTHCAGAEPSTGRSAHHRLTAWFARHPTFTDTLLAVVLAVLAVVGHLAADASASERDPNALGVALAIGAHLPLALRRRAPLVSLGVVAASTWAFWVGDFATSFDAGLLVALYSAAAHEPIRRRALGGTVAVLAISAGIIVAGIATIGEDVDVGTLVAVVTVLGIAIAMGDNMRHRRAYLAELQARAERAEADREREAERAVADERARIARELHDVVAHGMSVMVVQAGAARRIVDRDPAMAERALGTIESTGREALVEMRRVLGALRNGDSGAALAPQPSLSDFDQLVAQTVEAGVPVDLRIEGEPRELGAGLELAGFRIVQEALTNVRKHAGRASAVVTLRHLPHALEVEVVDDGRGAAAAPPEPGAGHGIVGMRERVDLYDGVLEVGPVPGGGFRVRAVLPVDSPAEAAVAGGTAHATGDRAHAATDRAHATGDGAQADRDGAQAAGGSRTTVTHAAPGNGPVLR